MTAADVLCIYSLPPARGVPAILRHNKKKGDIEDWTGKIYNHLIEKQNLYVSALRNIYLEVMGRDWKIETEGEISLVVLQLWGIAEKQYLYLFGNTEEVSLKCFNSTEVYKSLQHFENIDEKLVDASAKGLYQVVKMILQSRMGYSISASKLEEAAAKAASNNHVEVFRFILLESKRENDISNDVKVKIFAEALEYKRRGIREVFFEAEKREIEPENKWCFIL